MPIPIANGEELPRQFDPSMDIKYAWRYTVSKAEYKDWTGLLCFNKQAQFDQLRSIYMTGPNTRASAIEADTLVAAIGTAYRKINGQEDSAVGVSFSSSSRSRHDRKFVLNEPSLTCDLLCDLYALNLALRAIGQLYEKHRAIRDVKIRTNSPFLVDVFAWRTSIDQACKRHYPDDQFDREDCDEIFAQADKVQAQMIELEDLGLSVELWLTDDVADAENLARDELGERLGREDDPHTPPYDSDDC